MRRHREIRMLAYRWLQKNAFASNRKYEEHLKNLQTDNVDPIKVYFALFFVIEQMIEKYPFIINQTTTFMNYWDIGDNKAVISLKEQKHLYDRICGVLEDLGQNEAKGVASGKNTGIL